MGYGKIVKYGDIIEFYQYEKEIKENYVRKQQTAIKRYAEMEDRRRNIKISPNAKSFDRKKSRKNKVRAYAISKGTYRRSKASIARSRVNFYRLCHHNNYLASISPFSN